GSGVSECLSAVLDILNGVSDNLWGDAAGDAAIGMKMEPTGETTFPYGTHVAFIPVPGSPNNEFSGVFTLTKSPESPTVIGTLSVRGSFGVKGEHLVTKVVGRSNELNGKQLVTAATVLAMASTSRLPEK
ncbi:MAG: hypothetical protein AAB685_03420, partial [Patescibacteria group bacterium]